MDSQEQKESKICIELRQQFSGCGLEGDMVYYAPYKKYYPRDQATLLELWDKLEIPHKEKKQIFGLPLVIIGISVDVNKLMFKLSEEARQKLVEELKWWTRAGGKERLRRWYQMGVGSTGR